MLFKYIGKGKIIFKDQRLSEGDTIELDECDRKDFEPVTTPKKRAKRS